MEYFHGKLILITLPLIKVVTKYDGILNGHYFSATKKKQFKVYLMGKSVKLIEL